MADYSKFYEARKIISGILEKDFVGPVTKDEYLAEIPVQYYIMGKLYPQKNTVKELDLARNSLFENEIETYDASISLSSQNNPSSMGITIILKPDVNTIYISGSYAFYEPIALEEAPNHNIDTSFLERLNKKPKEIWQRKEFSYAEKIVLSEKKVMYVDLPSDLQLQVYIHSISENGERVVTIVLLNKNKSKNELSSTAETSKFCAFQPVIKVTGNDDEAIFTNANRQTYLTTDSELLELDMLYSDVTCYAQGHGCSVMWDMENPEPRWIASSFFPNFNLRQMKAAEIISGEVLSMQFLSSASVDNIVRELEIFVDKYRSWIEEQRKEISTVKKDLRDTAQSNVKKCQDACNRIDYAIKLLGESTKTDGKVFRAFQLANEAMLLQRKQTLLNSGKIFEPAKVKWYPFQLAFILHELTSFIEPKGHDGQEIPDRQLVDLLWFPTGGGKTEAYLGIAAFAVFLRRLREEESDGVTVIMRYTLRLLTLQQFERASILILACELLRKKYGLGGSEISIGLWVGGNLTPNNLSEAKNGVRKQQNGAVDEKPNPVQIKVCPWCGTKLSAQNYSVDLDNKKRMIISCPNPRCDFHSAPDGLPLHIIDEAIYFHLPTFIVATVDKFAQLPLSDKPAALFGITNNKKPPELIIQDELHLISGPLGTMTGIYEAAITKLCERNGVGAKVIASTATIRNAASQILALYGRKHTQFPPQGLSAKDSFFAVQSSPNERPARQHFGVMGIGTTATTTLIRVNAALLFATRYLTTKYPDFLIDNFWTIVGYFNSLRELGGADTQILDVVQSRLYYLAKTKFAALYPGVDVSKEYIYMEELTSRMSNSEIAEIIQVKLKRSYAKDNHADVFDYLLASNMISVGVDVSRLGTMVVAGQPKTNAEYIQATSRVGRDNPGLVIVVYNASRSRDRSHYEQFLKYHSSLYRYVEATSLTPFSDRARDRGLHALYVALCRYLINNLRSNNQAVNFNPNDPEIKAIEKIIIDYVGKVDPSEQAAVKKELEEIKEAWYATTEGGSLVYKVFYKQNQKMLLKNDTENDRFRTMNSMRNVDGQSGIYLLGGK